MRNEEREDSPEGNHRHRREDPPEERQEQDRAASPETTSSEDRATWNFLEGAEDFDDDSEEQYAPRSSLRSSSSSDNTCVVSEAPRSTVFERLKRKAPDFDNSPAAKKQPRQEDCLRRIRSALHCRRYRPKSIWDYETKTPWVSSIPAYFERRAFREWEEQGHTLQWYATGEIAAQLLTEAVSLKNLAHEIRINAAGKFLTTALATALGHVEVIIPALRNEVAKHFDKKSDKGLVVDLSPRQKKLSIIASRLYDLKDCISSIVIKKSY